MTLFEAVWNSLPHAKLVKSHAEHKINFNDRLRSPQALHKVLAPSGPRRHSGVSVVLQEWHRWPSVLRFYIAMYSNHYLVFSLLRCIPLTVLRLYFGRESWDIRAWRIAAYSESSSCTYKNKVIHTCLGCTASPVIRNLPPFGCPFRRRRHLVPSKMQIFSENFAAAAHGWTLPK